MTILFNVLSPRPEGAAAPVEPGPGASGAPLRGTRSRFTLRVTGMTMLFNMLSPRPEGAAAPVEPGSGASGAPLRGTRSRLSLSLGRDDNLSYFEPWSPGSKPVARATRLP
jgi:hypothetical protein